MWLRREHLALVTTQRAGRMRMRNREPSATGRPLSDDPETGEGPGSSDRGSAPAQCGRTGEEQAAINRENDPPA
jgi:hypothetical protein